MGNARNAGAVGLAQSSKKRPRSLSLKLHSLGDVLPSAILRIDPNKFVLGTTREIELNKYTVDGTPPDRPVSNVNTARLTLEQPVLTFDLRRKELGGTAVLSVPNQYPTTVSGPTKIPVQFFYDFDAPSTMRGRASLGPLIMNFRIQLKYDAGKVARTLATRLFGEKVSAALKNTGPEVNKPRDMSDLLPQLELNYSSVVKLALPFIESKLPLTSLTAWAKAPQPKLGPNSVEMSRYSLGYRAYGVIPTPPGGLFDVPALGLGYTRFSYDGHISSSFTGALLPMVSSKAISRGESAVARFPVYGYLEYSHLTRVSDGIELGFSATISGSSIDLARSLGAYQPQKRSLSDQIDDAQSKNSDSTPKPNVLLKFYGSF